MTLSEVSLWDNIRSYPTGFFKYYFQYKQFCHNPMFCSVSQLKKPVQDMYVMFNSATHERVTIVFIVAAYVFSYPKKNRQGVSYQYIVQKYITKISGQRNTTPVVKRRTNKLSTSRYMYEMLWYPDWHMVCLPVCLYSFFLSICKLESCL